MAIAKIFDGTSQVEISGGVDADAIHDNVASEISAITAKGTPVDGDFLIIEDSADGNAKKSITLADLPGGVGSNHDLLSTTHPDTTAAAVAIGAIVVGKTGPKWELLTLGASGQYLRSDGTDAVWAAIVPTDVFPVVHLQPIAKHHVDATKLWRVDLSAVPTGTTIKLIMPTGDTTLVTGTMVELALAQTLTNKTIDADDNTLKDFPYIREFYITDPTSTTVIPIMGVNGSITMVKVIGETDTGTVVFQLERRAEGSAFASGTNILSGTLTANTTPANTTSFASGGAVAANAGISIVVSGTPTANQLWVKVYYTVD